MRANPDGFVVSAMVEKLKPLGFKKGFFQSSQQFIYDAFLTYPRAVEACLPYSLLVGPDNAGRQQHCWAGVGMYLGWFGTFAIDKFFQSKTFDLDGMLLMVLIKPFFGQISDLLDPIPDETPIVLAPNPTTEAEMKESRSLFIRRIVRERCAADPLLRLSAEVAGKDIDLLPEFMVLSTPDASLVRIAERFVAGQRKGLSDPQIIQMMHLEFKIAMETASPFPFPLVPQPIDLWGYARYYLDCQHGHGVRLSDDYIDNVFMETFRFYNFSGSPRRIALPPS
jgi:hypothetical protein